jgi:hypothetical protein
MSFIPENLSTKQKVLAGVAVVALLVGGYLAYNAIFVPSGLPPVSATDGAGASFEATGTGPAAPASTGTTQAQPRQDTLPQDLRGGQRTAPQ